MKYEVGDRVRIKSLDWYNENKDNNREIKFENGTFTTLKSTFLGQIMTIEEITLEKQYILMEDRYKTLWTDEMIEGLVEEETTNIIEEAKNYWDSIKDAWICPEGYIFKDENGNVINATKIVLEKKKKEYPKTYEKCWYELKHDINHDKVEGYKSDILSALQKLLICRDAYWKIAGEEMGLGKPWELSIGIPIYYIYYNRTVGTIKNDYADDIQGNIILAFPTAEMRDAFKENFKGLIETVKGLL